MPSYAFKVVWYELLQVECKFLSRAIGILLFICFRWASKMSPAAFPQRSLHFQFTQWYDRGIRIQFGIGRWSGLKPKKNVEAVQLWALLFNLTLKLFCRTTMLLVVMVKVIRSNTCTRFRYPFYPRYYYAIDGLRLVHIVMVNFLFVSMQGSN